MRKFAARSVIIGSSVLAAVATVGVASAAWDASSVAGSTANSASKSKAVGPVSVAVSAPASAQLYPGASGDLTFTITNNNPFKVQVTGFSAGSPANIISNPAVDGCSGAATGISYNLSSGQTTLLTPFDLAAGGSTTVTLANAVQMSNSSVNACSGGVTYNLPIGVSASSDAGGSTSPAGSTVSVG